jgi:hypothetical protein
MYLDLSSATLDQGLLEAMPMQTKLRSCSVVTVATTPRHHHCHHHYHHHESGCPHRDEDVLSALQLFGLPQQIPAHSAGVLPARTSFHPATAALKPQST